MHSSFFIPAAFAALAAAVPVAQDLNWDLVTALVPLPSVSIPVVDVAAQATTVSYSSAAAVTSVAAQVASSGVDDMTDSETDNTDSDDSDVEKRDFLNSIAKRGNCASQAAGSGPVPTPDTASAFLALSAFASAATSAPTPSGYQVAFTNLNASNNAYGYMGYTLLSSYNVQTCANKCTAINGCQAFNIYFERDPLLDPGNGCDNPASTTNIKCVFWGGPVTTANANNFGQMRSNFTVVIAGSNGYINSSIASPAGYSTANYLGTTAINAPYDCNGDQTYMGMKLWNDGQFYASRCAAACDAQTAYNLAYPPSTGKPMTCQFYNTYILNLNGTGIGQYCSLYNTTWANSYGTNSGYYWTNVTNGVNYGTNHYTVSFSYTFSNTTNAGVCTKQ